MKIIITESQYRRLIEQEEPEVLHIPSLKYLIMIGIFCKSI